MQPIRFNTPHKRNKKRRGIALVEFALVIPFLLTMLIGIAEFGYVVRTNLTISNAAREGARTGSLGAKQPTIKSRVTSAAAPLDLTPAKGGDIVITQSLDNGTSYTSLPPDLANSNAVPIGAMLRVLVVTRHRSLTGFFPFINNKRMEGSATFRRE